MAVRGITAGQGSPLVGFGEWQGKAGQAERCMYGNSAVPYISPPTFAFAGCRPKEKYG